MGRVYLGWRGDGNQPLRSHTEEVLGVSSLGIPCKVIDRFSFFSFCIKTVFSFSGRIFGWAKSQGLVMYVGERFIYWKQCRVGLPKGCLILGLGVFLPPSWVSLYFLRMNQRASAG